ASQNRQKLSIMADIEQESGDNQEILATDAENESEFHENTNGEKSDLKERAGSRRPNRFQPYSKDKVGDKKGSHRNRVFISNIPYDMKWQAIKDLMRQKGMSGGGFNSMDGMGGFGGRDMAMGRMGDMYPSGMGSMNRDFGRNDMPMNRGYGDSFGGMGMGNYGGGMGSTSGGPMGSGGVMGNMGMDRMGSNFDRVGMDANRGFGGFGGGSGQMGGGNLDRGSRSKVGCQIFVRNLPYDLTWQKLKEKFSHCGQVMFAEIKMENGRSKGCGTVRFDSPESAEQACRLMNGIKINGREVDVRLDRNA
uniref:Myelin expression factor 2 n=1 Tax=Scleropages formosus TaxID=113540 RepID=A0A8C9TJZ3_SCLFO